MCSGDNGGARFGVGFETENRKRRALLEVLAIEIGSESALKGLRGIPAAYRSLSLVIRDRYDAGVPLQMLQ